LIRSELKIQLCHRALQVGESLTKIRPPTKLIELDCFGHDLPILLRDHNLKGVNDPQPWVPERTQKQLSRDQPRQRLAENNWDRGHFDGARVERLFLLYGRGPRKLDPAS